MLTKSREKSMNRIIRVIGIGFRREEKGEEPFKIRPEDLNKNKKDSDLKDYKFRGEKRRRKIRRSIRIRLRNMR